MKHTLIKNVRIVDGGRDFISDVYIKGERVEKIASNISLSPQLQVDMVVGDNLVLIPGMIDAHVHFREPGLTYKGDMRSESAAAIAGGITSIMDMPNTIPSVLTLDLLEQKYDLSSQSC
jgi:dihydroorotase